MADHGQVEYATAEGNDLPAHEATYHRFVQLAFVGTCHAACIVIGLGIGALNDHWFLAFAVFLIATLVALHGLASGARLPMAVMVALSLVTLFLSSAG